MTTPATPHIPYHLPPHADPRLPNCGLTAEELAAVPAKERRLLEANWAPVTTPFRMAPVHARQQRVSVLADLPDQPTAQ